MAIIQVFFHFSFYFSSIFFFFHHNYSIFLLFRLFLHRSTKKKKTRSYFSCWFRGTSCHDTQQEVTLEKLLCTLLLAELQYTQFFFFSPWFVFSIPKFLLLLFYLVFSLSSFVLHLHRGFGIAAGTAIYYYSSKLVPCCTTTKHSWLS